MDYVKNNYWGSKGLFQDLVDKLNPLVPFSGPVPRGNKHLERFRRASNAYYDIFNNGGCNRASSIRHYFGVSMSTFRIGYGRYRRTDFDRIFACTEPVMHEIILHAALEQGLITQDAADRYLSVGLKLAA